MSVTTNKVKSKQTILHFYSSKEWYERVNVPFLVATYARYNHNFVASINRLIFELTTNLLGKINGWF